MLVGDNAMEVARDGADIAIDGPLVVIEDDDQTLGLFGNVVKCFKRNAVVECGIASHVYDVFTAAGHVARHRHSQRGPERGAFMASAITVVLAFGTEHEAVEPARLADSAATFAAAGENLVGVDLVADIEEKSVLGRVEYIVHGQGQLDYPEIRTE